MTALKAKDIAGLLKKRDPRWAAILIYGPDAGAVRERSDILARQVVDDLKDPFNFIELGEADLKEEPGRLVDEAAALSFMGGERVVRVRGSSETITSSAKLLLSSFEAETFKPNALTLIEAGALRKTAGLRKLFESSKQAAAIACYEDNATDLKTMVADALKAEGLTIGEEAMSALTASLGADRGISRSELDKLILYKGPASVRTEETDAEITLTDIQACLTDSTQDASSEIAMLAAGGNVSAVSKALWRASESGTSPVSILIFLQRHLTRLYTAQSLIGDGTPASAALKKLRPPVFYAEERAFQEQLRKWPLARLEAALGNLLETEHAAKTTGAPQKELVERAALRLAMMAAR